MADYGFDDSMSLQAMADGLRTVKECDWCEEKATLHHGGDQYCRSCWNEQHVTESEGIGDQEHAERQYNRYGPDGGV